MENKLESPDYQMDISENCTTENNSDSVSPTISNLQADIELNEEKCEKLSRISNPVLDHSTLKCDDLESIVNQNTFNLSVNTNQQSTSSTSSQRLTPVNIHPLIFDDEDNEEGEDLCSNSRNFPDLVLMTHTNKIEHNQQQQPPLRLNKPSTNGSNINSVNNNDGRNRIIPKYREPSPVSNFSVRLEAHLRSSWMFLKIIH